MSLQELTKYIEDDFNDNALTNRTGVKTGYVKEKGVSETGRLLKGITRPEWVSVEGTGSVSSGTVTLKEDSIATKSNITVGSFSIDFLDTTLGLGYFYIMVNETAGGSPSIGYMIYHQNSATRGNKTSFQTTSTEIITVGGIVTGTHRVTRNEYGESELFINGSSSGTGINAEITSSEFTIIKHALENDRSFDNVLIEPLQP